MRLAISSGLSCWSSSDAAASAAAHAVQASQAAWAAWAAGQGSSDAGDASHPASTCCSSALNREHDAAQLDSRLLKLLHTSVLPQAPLRAANAAIHRIGHGKTLTDTLQVREATRFALKGKSS